MPITLSSEEARVLGSLIEKSLTTPDQYPLTLHALAAACNQKSSRDPVMNLDETTVARALSTLREKTLAYTKSESGNRVPKFGHRVENLLKGGSAKEVGAVCVLLLRGPQTSGEIKTRTDRLCEFESVADVVTVLDDLANRPEGPIVVRLVRQPGQKEARFAQLFTGPIDPALLNNPSAGSEPPVPVPVSTQRVDPRTVFEERLKAVEQAVAELQERLGVAEKHGL